MKPGLHRARPAGDRQPPTPLEDAYRLTIHGPIIAIGRWVRPARRLVEMQLMARQHLPDAPEPTIRTNSNTQAAIDEYPAGVV